MSSPTGIGGVVEPYTDEELAGIRAEAREYIDVDSNPLRMLATIAARDAEIERMRAIGNKFAADTLPKLEAEWKRLEAAATKLQEERDEARRDASAWHKEADGQREMLGQAVAQRDEWEQEAYAKADLSLAAEARVAQLEAALQGIGDTARLMNFSAGVHNIRAICRDALEAKP